MNLIQRSKLKKKGELRIIGAISIDLNGVADEARLNEVVRKTRTQVVQAIAKEFCSNSSVHGVRYFTGEKRHWTERIWWVFSVVLSVILCVISIITIWMKWQGRPVIVSFDDRTNPISLIPFPAVSICTTNKFIEDKIDKDRFIETLIEMENNKNAYKRLTPQELNRLDAILHVCLKELGNLVDGVIIPRNEPIHKTIAEMSPDVNSVILFSTFMGNLVNPRPIFTGEGLCFTFNSLNSWEIFSDEITPDLMTVNDNRNASYWNVEDGYDSNVNESEIYPYRVFGAGLRDILTMILGITVDDVHKLCSDLAQGFRLLLHLPDELPRLPQDFVFIPIEQEIYISVKPNVITTSNGLRSYSPEERGCYFKSEHHLRFFKSYSLFKCEQECLANYTNDECGCVTFSMPRDKETKVCTMVDIRCYIDANDRFAKDLMVRKCKCLPDCTSITYDLEISQTPMQMFDSDGEIAHWFMRNESSFETTTKLFVGFREHHFISINRTESSTFADFVASCGGLLGLFMGISLLSVIELIYYFTLRLCCKLRQQKPLKKHAPTWAKRTNISAIKRQYQRRRIYY